MNIVNIGFITGNKVLDVSVLAWFIAQLIKVIIELSMRKKFNIKRFFGAGGMPSSHSAFVVAMTIAVGKVSGFYSPIFALSVGFALVVMFDAQGIRRSAGEQAKVLNHIMDNWEPDESDESEGLEKDLKELLGHTPVEVVAGAILGIMVGIFV